MIRQEAFSNLTAFFVDYLLNSSFFKKISSKKSKNLYRALLNISLEKQEKILVVNYKGLKERLGYEYNNIRRALLELEKLSLITKTQMPSGVNFFIELNPEYWVDNKKNYMKEKFEDTRSLLGEINEAIGFEHEHEQCHALMSIIMDSLEEIEFIIEDKIC